MKVEEWRWEFLLLRNNNTSWCLWRGWSKPGTEPGGPRNSLSQSFHLSWQHRGIPRAEIPGWVVKLPTPATFSWSAISLPFSGTFLFPAWQIFDLKPELFSALLHAINSLIPNYWKLLLYWTQNFKKKKFPLLYETSVWFSQSTLRFLPCWELAQISVCQVRCFGETNMASSTQSCRPGPWSALGTQQLVCWHGKQGTSALSQQALDGPLL